MFQFRLQAWGGRGGSLSAKNTSSTYVSGGKVATVEYYNPNNGSRIEKIRTFANNDGFVKDLEVFTTSNLAKKQYDVVVPLRILTWREETPYLGSSKEGFTLGRKTGRSETAHIGINVNTPKPKGVSEKQEADAKKAAIRMMQRSAEHFVNGVAYRQTTLEKLGEVFKKQPALSAMQTLELNSKIR